MSPQAVAVGPSSTTSAVDQELLQPPEHFHPKERFRLDGLLHLPQVPPDIPGVDLVKDEERMPAGVERREPGAYMRLGDPKHRRPEDALLQSGEVLAEDLASRLEEMLELGPEEAALHTEAGREIAATGIDVLWGVRGLSQEIVLGGREAGLRATKFFDSSDEAAAELMKEVKEGDLILVKGSRGVATDKIVKALRERYPLVGEDER